MANQWFYSSTNISKVHIELFFIQVSFLIVRLINDLSGSSVRQLFGASKSEHGPTDIG